MRVAVVIPTRNRPGQLGECLRALAGAVRPGDEVLVVDSASRGDDVARLAAAAGVRALRCERPGASRARNAGAAAAEADILAFTDDDCRPRAGWTQAIAAAFESEELTFLTGRVLPGGGGGPPVSVLEDDVARELRSTYDPASLGHAANMAVRRDAFHAIGGFDELLGAGALLRAAEDKDIFQRLLAAGWRGRHEPDVTVEHEAWRSRSQVVRLAFAYGCGSGALTAKAGAQERSLGRQMLVRAAWGHGLREGWRDLRSGYQLGALCGVARSAGALAGALRARQMVVRDGRFLA